MMSKNFLLVAFCIALIAMVAYAADPVITAKFIGDSIVSSSNKDIFATLGSISLPPPALGSVVQFEMTNVDLRQGARFIPGSAADDDGSKTHYYTISSSVGNIGHISGYQPKQCWDEATKQVIATVSVAFGQFTITGNALYTARMEALEESARITTKTVVNCVIVFDQIVGTTIDNFNLDATFTDYENGSSDDLDVTLAFPTKGFVQPQVDFKSASITAAKRQGETTEIKVEFTTDTAGIYSVDLVNGLDAYPSNMNNGELAPFYCQSGSKNDFARIYYTAFSTVNFAITLHVPEASTKDSIKCTFYFDSPVFDAKQGQFVESDKISVRLAVSQVEVFRSLDAKWPVATVTAKIDYYDDELDIKAVLSGTSTHLKTNSTVKFKFSSTIDVTKFILNEGTDGASQYRANSNCDYIYATSKIDAAANTVILSDILLDGNFDKVLSCSFNFNSAADAFDFTKGRAVDMHSVTVSIDGVELLARSARGNAAPMYLKTVGLLNLNGPLSSTTVDGTANKYQATFSFDDNYRDYHTTMQNPVVLFGFSGHDNHVFPYASDKSADQLKCQLTSPTTSLYKDLVLKFDQNTLTWSAPLKDLVDIESYSILIKCNFSIDKAMVYGIDYSFNGGFEIVVVDLIDGKRYYDHANTSYSLVPIQATSQTGQYPETSVQLIKIEQSFVPATAFTYDVLKAQETTSSTDLLKVLDDNFKTDNVGWTFKTVKSFSELNTSDGVYSTGNLIKPFVDEVLQSTTDFKAFLYESLSIFFNLNPTAEFVLSIWSVNNLVTKTKTWITAAKGSTATNSAAVVYNGDGMIPYEKAFYDKQYKKDTILDSVDSTYVGDDSSISYSPIDGCGVANTYLRFQQPAGFNKKDADEGTADQKWTSFLNDFNTSSPDFFKCQTGQQCKTNSDCDGNSLTGTNVCIANVCTVQKTVKAPFIRVKTDGTTEKVFDSEYYSSATMTSALAVVVVAALVVTLF